MLQRTCSGSLYAVLEVARDATPQEIKKAYHRLALRLHPDKTGGTTTEQFTLIQEAQSILGDPRQRRVYDTFGRMGIESLRQFGDGMVVMTTAGIRCAFFIIAFWMLLWLLTLVLAIVRFDYNKGWPWAAVFAPVWVALVPLLLIGGLLVFHGATRREIASTLLGLMCFLVTFAVAMFVVGLSGALTWTIALAPSAAIYVFQSCFILRYLLPFQFRNGFAEFIPPGSSVCLSRMYWGFCWKQYLKSCVVSALLVLPCYRGANRRGRYIKTDLLLDSFYSSYFVLWVHDVCFCRTKIFCGNSGGAVMSPEPTVPCADGRHRLRQSSFYGMHVGGEVSS
uniref:DnaJ-like protein G3 n=1 Tax=Trypanosoma cruzi TaxID=5693 RepID=Q5XXD7_TRYCR|nr:DnaJ-like protein G3 [Trypanosoma cruzi]